MDTKDNMVLLWGCVVIISIVFSHLIITKRDLGDEYLFLIVSMLVSIGVIMIYRLDKSMGIKQIIFYIIGISLFFLSGYIYGKISQWHKLHYVYIGGSLLLYFVTLVLGRNVNGAKNWIFIGGYSFQLSEITKILFILFLACYFKNPHRLFFVRTDYNDKLKILMNKIMLTVVTFMNIGFLIIQREWGTVLLFFSIYLIILYVFSKDRILFILNFALTLPISMAGYFFLNHIRVRVDTWVNPWSDIAGKGYQVTQSLFAIVSGGFFGTGIGMGRPDMVPAVTTDFIFSAVCEEMGTFGGVAIILLYMLLAYRGIKIVLSLNDRFNKVLAFGITVMLGVQTFIIIGGVIKLIPLTGITLPYISYGGSSLVTYFISLGILQGISKGNFYNLEGDNVE